MTEEKYQDIKEGYLNNIKKYMLSSGSLFPHITVFGEHIDDKKDSIIHIPIPDDFMKSEDTKEQFVQSAVPKIAEKLQEQFTPYGVGWASEAWVRMSDKEPTKDWKKLPIKKEVLIVVLEFDYKKESFIYDINRKGKQVNEDGDLVDHIELIEQELNEKPISIGGRFTGLLDKFKTK